MTRVLLLEPDKLLANTYAQALEEAGYAVSVAHSAQAAIDAADTAVPDLVVLELQLPGHDGVEFLYEFRSYAEWQTVPAVIHSYVPSERLAQVRETLQAELGVVDLLYKPQTSLQRLLAAVRTRAGAAV